MLNIFRKRAVYNLFHCTENLNNYYYFSKADPHEIQKILKKVFLSTEGRKVLAYLSFITCQKVQNANVSKEHLYYLEGQRALINNIQKIILNNKPS